MGKLSDVTETIYRAFPDERYARAFIENGKFRLRRLDLYRNIEDGSRRDDSEGLGMFVDESGCQNSIEMSGSIYVLCCATAKVDLPCLRERFGPYIVRINDPAALAHDIGRFLNACGISTFNGVHGRGVEYTKGGVIVQELDAMQRAVLSITQKPVGYAGEVEYRLFTILSNAAPNGKGSKFLNINVGHRLRYAELIE